jgi:hypothetical protein
MTGIGSTEAATGTVRTVGGGAGGAVVGAAVGGGSVVACTTSGGRSTVRTGGVAATADEPLDAHDDVSNDATTVVAIGRRVTTSGRGFDVSRVESPSRTTVLSKVVTRIGSFADTHVPTTRANARDVSCTARAIRTTR